MSRIDYRGATALVTGASSGIGRALAHELARRGAGRVLAVARRRDRLEELADALAPLGTEVEVLALDLTDAAARDSLLDDLARPERTPDIVVNNAGLGMNRRFLASDETRMHHLVELDLEVPIRISHALGRSMRDRGHGAILNVASIAGLVPTPHHGVYSATKAALVVFSESLHLELKPAGVTVTCACPGVTDTEFFEAGRYVTKSPIYRMRRADPRAVAIAALDALSRRRMTTIIGLRNRLLVALTRLLPRPFVTSMSGRTMKTD